MEIKYSALDLKNFGGSSLDNFIRFQKVTQCWRLIDGEYKLARVEYIEDWDLNERREMANRISCGLKNGCIGYGAFTGTDAIGFAYLDKALFGSRKQYIDLAEFYVSEPFRGTGVGRKLFNMACNGARSLGAEKLYISAHSAKESIAAYRAFGCGFAEEVNAFLAEKEPFDLQLEYVLK
ncbi:MAG: GNAT family N-acetyltransferase [Clostridia bacterium]|nr:GNAT family N-acetyltransferase [Clostridia bacterium]